MRLHILRKHLLEEVKRLQRDWKTNRNLGAMPLGMIDSDVSIRVELSMWPLQETPSVTIMIQNMELELDGDSGMLETVYFHTDHLEADLVPEDFNIPERIGFTKTPLAKLREHLAREWNAGISTV